MDQPTAGVQLRSGSRTVRDAVELLSSMRFAISLLSLICIASVIGTVVRQHEPYNNYLNQFGPFWARVFDASGIYAVYSAWWFLVILAFLVLSTSLCILRNAPKIVTDLRSFKENVREQSLGAFHHKGEHVRAGETPEAALQRLGALLDREGWRARAQVRDNGTMIAARKGSANKVGYLFAHTAIVLICLGGLADGDLIVRARMALAGKTPYDGGGLIRDVAPEHRLGAATPAFRGNILVPEGGRAGVAILNMSDGIVLQDLPFDIELKKFIVDYYSTGMPKLFASEIVIHDHETGQATPATVKVNEPAFHRGIAIYQSSFDDGGSHLTLRAHPLIAVGASFDIQATVGDTTTLRSDRGEQLGLELTGLRVINVENLGAADGSRGTDVRAVDLAEHLGSGAKVRSKKELRNVGPSFSYKLVDSAGQRREYSTYMQPVELDGHRVLLAGVRDTPNDPFRYLRIPVDASDSIAGWLQLRQALTDPAMRAEATRRYVDIVAAMDKPETATQLRGAAELALARFAGAAREADEGPGGGLEALSETLRKKVPEAERERMSQVLLRVLNGCLFELANVARQKAGQPPMANDEATQQYMTAAVLSLSDSLYYPAPVLLTLESFQQVQASVFQVARAPGKVVVYLGAVCLILGVFTMLYVRERRLWIWLQPADGGVRIRTALSTTRRTLDADAEFDKLKAAILQETT